MELSVIFYHENEALKKRSSVIRIFFRLRRAQNNTISFIQSYQKLWQFYNRLLSMSCNNSSILARRWLWEAKKLNVFFYYDRWKLCIILNKVWTVANKVWTVLCSPIPFPITIINCYRASDNNLLADNNYLLLSADNNK